jgi:hypothetical protein
VPGVPPSAGYQIRASKGVQDDRVGVEELGYTKIQDLDTGLGQNDVPWLQLRGMVAKARINLPSVS